MGKILHFLSVLLFSLTVISCAKEEEEKVEAPVIAEVTPVTTPTFNSTPGYTFSSTKAGTITYGGSCSSWTTSATSGNNTILFKPLSYGTYSDCTMIVTDSDGNASNTLSVTSFTIYTQTKLMSGGYYNCALFGISSLKCWGENTYGQLGLGDNSTRGDGSGEMGDNLSVVDLGTGRTAKAVTMGHDHTCAILDNDSVKCWGRGRYGQLGYGNTNDLGDDSGEMGDNLPNISL